MVVSWGWARWARLAAGRGKTALGLTNRTPWQGQRGTQSLQPAGQPAVRVQSERVWRREVPRPGHSRLSLLRRLSVWCMLLGTDKADVGRTVSSPWAAT